MPRTDTDGCGVRGRNVRSPYPSRKLKSESKKLNALKISNAPERQKRRVMRRIVCSVAGYYFRAVSPKNISFTGLAKAGLRGCDKADEKFDPLKECSFGDYVVFSVNFEIRKALIDAGEMIRVPVHKHGQHSELEFDGT